MAGVVLLFFFTGCTPQPASSPSSGGCDGYVSAAGEDVPGLIRSFWADDPPTAEWLIHVVAPRESGCDPCASYPGQHDCNRHFDINHVANGVLQNLGSNTAAALASACPYLWPGDSWHVAECSLQVSRWKYEGWRAQGGSGREPWGG